MYRMAKELVDRFIEWLLARAGGSTLEEKLMSALKTVSFMCVGLLWAVVTLLVIDFNMKIRLNDTENAASVVNKMFDPDNNPLDEFVTINQELTQRMHAMQGENVLLLRDNLILVQDNKRLSQENNLLREEVKSRGPARSPPRARQ